MLKLSSFTVAEATEEAELLKLLRQKFEKKSETLRLDGPSAENMRIARLNLGRANGLWYDHWKFGLISR